MGRIISISHSVVYASGLPSLKLGEAVISESQKGGIVYGLDKNGAEILMFDVENLKTDEAIAKTGDYFKFPVNQNVLGRVINPLGKPIDGFGPVIGEKDFISIQNEAPNITKRARINKAMETGVVIVDLLIPIGYGQRELVIGDEKTGKSTFLLQTIVSQAKKGAVCVYVLIGKRTLDAKNIEEYLKEKGVFDNVAMVSATPDNPTSVLYLAPYTGMAIAEYFRDLGKNVIIIFDDLSVHAKAYREISLLLKRIPGRGSYPGDIFHLHAALLERAGNIKHGKNEEVSITAFPVAETLENDIAGYIQTNLMAMTDGHIFFDINEHRRGHRPAINAFLSVSRVGNQTKIPIERALANWIRKKLAEYQRASEIAQFGIDLPEHTREAIDTGEKIKSIFTQSPHTIIAREFQLILFGLLLADFWKNKNHEIMQKEIEDLTKDYERGNFGDLTQKIKELKTTDELIAFVDNNLSNKIHASIDRN